MEFRVFDQNFEVFDVVDIYESIIWTTRFQSAGDFELVTPVTEKILNAMRIGFYFFCNLFYDEETDTGSLMVIESIEIESDPENGNKLKVVGRDLKSILDRRIIWGLRTFTTSDNLKDCIIAMLNENIIDPQDWSKTYQDSASGTITISDNGADRKIDNFEIISDELTWPTLTGDCQYSLESLYAVMEDLMPKYNIGYDIVYDFTNKKFLFSLKQYRYRVYDIEKNPNNSPILFSPGFENLRNSNYIESGVNEKNVALIGGEGDEYNIMYQVINGGQTGLNRKELGVSGSDVARKDDTGWEAGNAEYLQLLKDKGQAELDKNIYTQTYEGTAETIRGYQYPKDFNTGDIVEIINEWGISSEVLISEVVISVSSDGVTVTPTFSTLTEGGE